MTDTTRGGGVALFDCRDAFAGALMELAANDPRIVAVVNDSVGSSKLAGFRDRFPDRMVNVGIAEQAMVGVAAGLAAGGRIPFVSAASCFLTARAMEQIKVDIAYSRRHVVLCGMSPGVAYGELGPTHHSPEDLAWLRAIPGLVVIAPADPVETAAAVRWAAENDGPAFLRISRMGVPALHDSDYRFEPGIARVLRHGDDVTIAATGACVAIALAAADDLAIDGVAARVVSFPTVSPLDLEAVSAAAEETSGIVVVEEAYSAGLGGALAEAVVRSAPAPMRFVGLPHEFAPTASTVALFERAGLTAGGVAAAARELVDRSGRGAAP